MQIWELGEVSRALNWPKPITWRSGLLLSINYFGPLIGPSHVIGSNP